MHGERLLPLLVLFLPLMGFLGQGCRHPGAYPIGIYSVNRTNDFAEIRDAGFNTITGPATKPFLDAARAHGLRVLATPGSSAGPRFNAAKARSTVRAHDAHPALWAWYLIDEPDLNLVSPDAVAKAHRALKNAGAKKPTSVVLMTGQAADDYGHIPDWLLVDRYPVPWIPLADFSKHITLARHARGPRRPLAAIIQAFDWTYYRRLLGLEVPLRPPTEREMRCMTYLALACGANGLFYYAFDSTWKMREHPDTWASLRRIVREVNMRLPLFQAEHRWWGRRHTFADKAIQFNSALDASVASVLLRVKHGNPQVPPGDYILAVNNTDKIHQYRFTPPLWADPILDVLGESRMLVTERGWIEDTFAPYAVHIYFLGNAMSGGRQKKAER